MKEEFEKFKKLEKALYSKEFLKVLTEKYKNDEEFVIQLIKFSAFSSIWRACGTELLKNLEGKKRRECIKGFVQGSLKISPYKQARFLKLFMDSAEKKDCWHLFSYLEKLEIEWSQGKKIFNSYSWGKEKHSSNFQQEILGGGTVLMPKKNEYNFWEDLSIDEDRNKQNLRWYLLAAKNYYENRSNTCNYKEGIENLIKSVSYFNEIEDRIKKENRGFAVFRVWYEDHENKPMWLKSKAQHIEASTGTTLSALPRNIVQMVLNFVDPEIYGKKLNRHKRN